MRQSDLGRSTGRWLPTRDHPTAAFREIVSQVERMESAYTTVDVVVRSCNGEDLRTAVVLQLKRQLADVCEVQTVVMAV